MRIRRTLLAVTALVTALAAGLALAQTAPLTPDIPQGTFAPSTAGYDYVKREVMIPMRDGVKLHTVIVIPKGARNAPILLTRTPYNADGRAARIESPHMLAELPQGDEVFVRGGYIRVFQDVRGKYGSEGEYVMTRPLRGPLNSSEVDHSTDAYDTIDWLVKNVPESNGKVGMIGSSYEGFTVVMALIHPHPALKVAAPESPMVDGWMGDDWFHYGAFRQTNLDYIYRPDQAERQRRQRAARGLRRLQQLPRGRLGRRLCARPRLRAAAVLAQASTNTRPTTRSGRTRRWTRSWPGSRSRFPPCGCRACGIRKTCGAPSTATRRPSPRTRTTTRTSW